MTSDGILAGPIDLDAPRHGPAFARVDAAPGLRVRHRDSGLEGVVTGCTSTAVRLRDPQGQEHTVTNAAGAFVFEGAAVNLVPPARGTAPARDDPDRPRPPTRTASGSIASAPAPARVARGSRIWVEGIHDAELVEKVWGDDLRSEAVVVEPLGGADDLVRAVEGFAPGPDRRLGILLDHLVAGTKEEHLARLVRSPHVLVQGHPFVDIWQAVRPAVVGIEAWPEIPPGRPWKEGICAALGWSGSTHEMWVRILASVDTYRDLEPSLLAAVETLIDFVAPPPTT